MIHKLTNLSLEELNFSIIRLKIMHQECNSSIEKPKFLEDTDESVPDFGIQWHTHDFP